MIFDFYCCSKHSLIQEFANFINFLLKTKILPTIIFNYYIPPDNPPYQNKKNGGKLTF